MQVKDVEDFREFDIIGNMFLRFEKDILSSDYADEAIHPSLKSFYEFLSQ